MIKEKRLIIKVNQRNISYYREKGYNVDCISFKDNNSLEVDIEDVSINSKEKVTAICKICGSENIISVQKYYVNFSRNSKNYYSCFDCKNVAKEDTCLKKYGFKSYSQTDIFKINESIKKKGNKETWKKVQATCLEKYGVDSYFKTDQMKEYNRSWMSSEEFRSKSNETMQKRYGTTYVKTDLFKRQIEQKKNQMVEKIKKTTFQKYGVEWISMSTEIQEKIKNKKIENGHILSDDLLSEFLKYRKKVRNQTNKFKKILFENWDGFDYYDQELIKGNFCYDSKHKDYPSIDHKISIYYGFLNQIDVEAIGDLSNLCITKRRLNSSKRAMTEQEFLEKFGGFST